MAVINSNRFNFAETVQAYMQHYSAAATDVLEESIKEVGKEAVSKLKDTSPRRTGAYAKNWKFKTEVGRLKVGGIVYGGKPTYRIAHLLEYGHAKRGGGREVAGIEHIRPVEQWAVDEAVDRFIQKMEKLTI